MYVCSCALTIICEYLCQVCALRTQYISPPAANPGIIPVQEEVVVVENRTFSLSVFSSVISSPGSRSYIWQHNGSSLSSTSRTLTVSSANISHNGTYNCTLQVSLPPLGQYSSSTFINVIVFGELCRKRVVSL